MVVFHGYVSLPEGICIYIYIYTYQYSLPTCYRSSINVVRQNMHGCIAAAQYTRNRAKNKTSYFCRINKHQLWGHYVGLFFWFLTIKCMEISWDMMFDSQKTIHKRYWYHEISWDKWWLTNILTPMSSTQCHHRCPLWKGPGDASSTWARRASLEPDGHLLRRFRLAGLEKSVTIFCGKAIDKP